MLQTEPNLIAMQPFWAGIAPYDVRSAVELIEHAVSRALSVTSGPPEVR
jgi:hypothetical protein